MVAIGPGYGPSELECELEQSCCNATAMVGAILLLIISVPFERIGTDQVGSLPKSAKGHEYILVIVNYAMRYPEAVVLKKVSLKNIARKLVYQILHVLFAVHETPQTSTGFTSFKLLFGTPSPVCR